jgi:hypothetical protein
MSRITIFLVNELFFFRVILLFKIFQEFDFIETEFMRLILLQVFHKFFRKYCNELMRVLRFFFYCLSHKFYYFFPFL